MYAQTLGGERRTLLENDQRSKYPAQWSKDGRFLLYRATSAGTQGDVWALPLTKDAKPIPVVTTPFDETRPQFSPDGSWVSYESNESGRPEVYIRPFNRNGVPVQVSVNGGTEARWNPNGREIFYLSPGARMMAASVRPSATKDTIDVDPAVELFTTPIYRGGQQTSNYRSQYAVSSDGQRFLVNETIAGTASPIILTLNWRPPQTQ